MSCPRGVNSQTKPPQPITLISSHFCHSPTFEGQQHSPWERKLSLTLIRYGSSNSIAIASVLTIAQGIDDVLALLLALSATPEEVEVLLISLTFGNIEVEK